MNDIEKAIKDLRGLNERSSKESELFKIRHSENFNIAISALEKQMPKKILSLDGLNETRCPRCNFVYGYGIDEYDDEKVDYCFNCGQKLDWSEVEDE